ncbi:MAG: HepT-like ribonuclease domain-containing protein [Steroidobacteraceae bacterium]
MTVSATFSGGDRAIERYTEGLTETVFLSKDHGLVQDAVIGNFEIIGEASRNIAKRHPQE